MRRLRSLLVPAAVAALALGGCAALTGEDGGADEDGALDVLVSFYPLQFVAEQIGGERLDVSSLTPPGADPHSLELAPRTVSDMDGAALVVYLSGFQAAVDEAVAGTAAPTFDAADHTELLSPDHTEHDDQDGHDHGAENLDPHFWLDPARLAEVADALAEELAGLDPDGAATYRENADALVDELQDLDEDLTATLTRCERDTIVVAHEAYGYLTTDRGLHQEGLSGIDPESEPSPARLADITRVVSEHDVETIFVESLVSPAVSEALARDLGVSTTVLDPLENQLDESADYLDVMRANLAALSEALGCSSR
ncbi:metal ABC transporter substrate-binding protein [Georgenia satyanarayanai]|uniref:metal ABC transporter substrate-binding protein n=1 Tax=Georgenia satyanarayanai TaxID=860221 RepID=UPI00126468B2|nr:metal ABC transporter substrate-binding protein [Georgenia satyanarayanai]